MEIHSNAGAGTRSMVISLHYQSTAIWIQCQVQQEIRKNVSTFTLHLLFYHDSNKIWFSRQVQAWRRICMKIFPGQPNLKRLRAARQDIGRDLMIHQAPALARAQESIRLLIFSYMKNLGAQKSLTARVYVNVMRLKTRQKVDLWFINLSYINFGTLKPCSTKYLIHSLWWVLHLNENHHLMLHLSSRFWDFIIILHFSFRALTSFSCARHQLEH